MTTKVQQFELPGTAQGDDEPEAHHRQLEHMQLRGLIPAELASMPAWTQAIPDQVFLGCLRDGRLKVYSPIMVKLTSEGEHVVAEAIEFDEFGFGNNLSQALVDLQRAIAELYFTLEKEQGRLGPDLQRVWANLRQKITRRR
jgi:hypothetical protein